MIALINQLIAINLQLFFTAEHNQLQLKDFRDCEGKQISGAKLLADIMQNKELIQPSATEKNTYQLTEVGNNICLFGGWEKHLKNESRLKAIIQEHNATLVDEETKGFSTIIVSVIAIAVMILAIWIL